MTGPFQLGTPQRFADFTDGLSNVIFVGDKQVPATRMGIGTLDNSLYNSEYAYSHGRGVLAGLTTDPRSARPSFGSRHTGVVMFCFGDARMRPISENINRYTFELLGTRGHGQVIPDF